jgi:hypothetical protein
MIRTLYDIQIVLDYHQTVVPAYQQIEAVDQLRHILEVKPGGWLVEYEQRVVLVVLYRYVRSQLYSLRLPPDRVFEGCPNFMYPIPTICRVFNSRTSRSCPSKNFIASSTVS